MFIELTFQDGDKFMINFNCVSYFHDHKKGSYIYSSEKEERWNVKETKEEIKIKLWTIGVKI